MTSSDHKCLRNNWVAHSKVIYWLLCHLCYLVTIGLFLYYPITTRKKIGTFMSCSSPPPSHLNTEKGSRNPSCSHSRFQTPVFGYAFFLSCNLFYFVLFPRVVEWNRILLCQHWTSNTGWIKLLSGVKPPLWKPRKMSVFTCPSCRSFYSRLMRLWSIW